MNTKHLHAIHSDIDDDSHVILKPLPGHDDCQHDYINASYVDVSTSSLYKHRYCGMLIFQILTFVGLLLPRQQWSPHWSCGFTVIFGTAHVQIINNE